MAEAGHPNGFDVTMQVPQEREQRVRLGVAVRDMARAAGIRINVERVPFASYAAKVAGKAQMYVDGYFARPTIDTAVYPFYHSSGSWNRQLWLYTNKRVDELLDTARKTNEEDKRKAHLRRVPEDRRRDRAEPHRLRGRACERRAQGGRGLPLDADAVARAEGSHAQALTRQPDAEASAWPATSLRRLAFVALVLVAVSMLVFGITSLLPANVAYLILGPFAPPEQVRALELKLGLDRSDLAAISGAGPQASCAAISASRC